MSEEFRNYYLGRQTALLEEELYMMESVFYRIQKEYVKVAVETKNMTNSL